jgi:hypothetical protein
MPGRRFSGAFLNDTVLLGTLTGAHLRDLPAKQLLQMLRDRFFLPTASRPHVVRARTHF